MTQVERLVEQLHTELDGRTIIELACGSAEFSLAAAKYADKVVCLDLDDGQLSEEALSKGNIEFVLADAAHTGLKTGGFDMVVLYNALFHVKDQLQEIITEGKRLLKPDGAFLVISSWTLDKTLIEEMLGEYERTGSFFICRLD